MKIRKRERPAIRIPGANPADESRTSTEGQVLRIKKRLRPLEGGEIGQPAAQPGAPVGLPTLSSSQALDVTRLRDEYESLYLSILWAANIAVLLALATVAYLRWQVALFILLYAGFLAAMLWVSWKLTYAFIYGHGIEVGPNQFPQIYAVVKSAADLLQVPVPTIIVLQGHGMFELFVAKRFSRRGLIVVTSNMLDEFCERPSSREFMMFVGRQLGHIKAGHFRLWFFKDVIGLLAAYPFNRAWWRRCHFTADKIGLLVAGDSDAAEQALSIITVGARSAPGINIDQVVEQRTKVFESLWSWLQLTISEYPYMVDRITRLRRFALQTGANPIPNVGALPIRHYSLRAIPLLVIHGHDRLALLELKDHLRERFPQITLRLMASETIGALSLPEKFERVANDIRGAIALLTPDDIGGLHQELGQQQFRARQNVVMEVGWVWGHLGRKRCLLLVRGSVEMPSDLSGVDTYRFQRTPSECSEAVRDFVESLERELRLVA